MKPWDEKSYDEKLNEEEKLNEATQQEKLNEARQKMKEFFKKIFEEWDKVFEARDKRLEAHLETMERFQQRIKTSQKELEIKHKKLKNDHEELKSNFRKTQIHRAKILASQILLQFLGEQPRFTRPCNYFSDLSGSDILHSLVRAAFPEARKSDTNLRDLLKDFDELIQGINRNTDPRIDPVLFDEIEDLVRYLVREDRSERLSRSAFTALKVLKAQRDLARCQAYPRGSTHDQRKGGVYDGKQLYRRV